MEDVSKLDSIKLVYNEKTKRIVANLITDVDGVKVRSKTIDNLEVIKVLLEALIKQSKMSISQLIDEKIIIVDSKLLDEGVIALDSAKEYHKYIFDKEMGSFNEVRLSRMERKDLGLLKDDEISEVLPEETFNGDLEEVNIPVDGTIHETLENTPIIEETHETVEDTHEVNEDGSIDVENMSEGNVVAEENISGIRNLKINKRAIIALGLVPVICASSMLLTRDSKNNNASNKHHVFNNQRPIHTATVEISPEPEIFSSSTKELPNGQSVYTPTYETNGLSGANYVSNNESITYLTQEINNMCASLVPCNFYDFVDESERLSIKAINEYRNAAMNDRSKVVDLMNAYLKYILEGDIWFENDVIRGYDYLTPLAKYAVLVSGQTILSLCPYDYSYSNLDYNEIIDEFDNRVNDIYSELLNKGRTI